MPSLIVIHYTAMRTCAEARARLCDPAAEVSAHWLIDRDGGADALVPEAMRAWHAGAGEWAGQGDVNSRSIGIELVNDGAQPFAAAQMAGLEQVLRGALGRWGIPPQGVIAHSDMAPGRKTDPGARFDWLRLARAGLSVWPDVSGIAVSPGGFLGSARRFGYPDVAEPILLAAFRLRFRPAARGPQGEVDAAMAFDLARRFAVDAPAHPA